MNHCVNLGLLPQGGRGRTKHLRIFSSIVSTTQICELIFRTKIRTWPSEVWLRLGTGLEIVGSTPHAGRD